MVTVNNLESCIFTCDCLYSDPCIIDFTFLNVVEEGICEIDIPDELSKDNVKGQSTHMTTHVCLSQLHQLHKREQ